jgi:small conductance mechanosensitive channel
MKENKSKKIINIIEIILGALIIVLLVGTLVLQLVNPELELSIWVRDNIWNVNASIEGIKAQLPEIIQCIIYIFLILSVSKILRMIFKVQINKSDRAKTVITLFDGLVKYGCAIAIIILVLKACGVDTSALIASVGVLTLIVGLGAQTLIADIIAGVFIIFENEFNTGETISIDGFRGKVIEIGIRTTKLLDAAGNIKIVNHSNIVNVVNLSRELSLAVVDCDFPYDIPIEHIEGLFEKKFPVIAEKIPTIVEGPYYKGVSEYKDSNVTVKIVALCHEDNRFQVQRDLMREYRAILTEEGIDISYPQVVINQAEPKKFITISKKKKKNADDFVEEQKDLSSDLEEQQH